MIIIRQKYFSKAGTKVVHSINKSVNRLRKEPLEDIALKRSTIVSKNKIKDAAGDINTVALTVFPGRVITVPAYEKFRVREKIQNSPVLGRVHAVASYPTRTVASLVF